MSKIAAATVALILLSFPALGDPQAIRAKLLGIPVWIFREGYEAKWPDQVHVGKVKFAEKDGKLIGYIDSGFKCDSEVTLREDGFDMETCVPPDKQFTQSGDEFKASFGTYKFSLTPSAEK
jgi:hypothetical protein